jgi:hypothetical protein
MATLEVTETRGEAHHRRNNEHKGGSFKIGGRQFPMDFPLLKNQDPAGPLASDSQGTGGKDISKGNSLLNALRLKPGESGALFGQEGAHSNIGHFDRMGTDISGGPGYMNPSMHTRAPNGYPDLATLLKPSLDQSELLGKPFSVGDQMYHRRPGDESVGKIRGGLPAFIDPTKPLIPGLSQQLGLPGNIDQGGLLNGHIKANHADVNQYYHEPSFRGGRHAFPPAGREQITAYGTQSYTSMLKKRKPYQNKKGEPVEISDVDEPPSRVKVIHAPHPADAGPNLIGTGSRLMDCKPSLGNKGRDRPYISDLHKLISKQKVANSL